MVGKVVGSLLQAIHGPLLSTLSPPRRDTTDRVDHSRRFGQLRRRMNGASVAGLLVTHLPDVRYLCGFSGSSAALAVAPRAARLFTDGRYRTQAGEEVKVAK